MLTLKKLKKITPGIIFLNGEIIDSPDGINMTNSKKQLRWLAVKGWGYDDWAIYCHFTDKSLGWIRQQGEKVRDKENVIRLIPCDEEALNLYRN